MAEGIIKGNGIYLKKLALSDVTTKVLKWFSDRETARYIESVPPRSIKDLKSFYKKVMESKNDKIFAIIAKENNIHIGNIKLGGINFKHRFADMGILIGEKDHRGKGYCRESVKLLLKYAFNTLKLNKVFLAVSEDNKAAVAAYRKAGFKVEGKLSGLYRYRSRRYGRLYMGISKDQYKYGDR